MPTCRLVMVCYPPDLRQKLRVNLVNVQGLDEPGIDGGGVFREFLSELLRTGFDPNHGFFCTTPDGLLYPNPQVGNQTLTTTVTQFLFFPFSNPKLPMHKIHSPSL